MTDILSDAPRGNASTKEWTEYAISKGVEEAELKDLTRDEIRELVEARAKQTADTSAPSEDTTENDGQETENVEAPAAPAVPDFSKFTGAPATAPQGVVAGAGDAQTEAPAPAANGHEVQVDDGTVHAIVVKGVYQLTTKDGVRKQAHKGDTVIATAEKIDRGVKHGFLQKV
ncbi:hypothetical protein [Nesterenkonia flava]|uniref:Uncharacterized protein n=1 Tax=Nesterenkonia flava TaxID=469799 RepID=A0ABU1FTA8_9MICC|nr:hypothetical protein [Nesterenkonia flava]MDR5711408.1 hypothetical protein [Nesterenkonia flava]